MAAAARSGAVDPSGKEDGEGAALPERATDRDLAAEQTDELAADREAEPGAAVEPRGGAVALGERLEDPLLLLVVDADARVADRDRDDRGCAGRATAISVLQPSSARPIWTWTSPRSVNLNALASRFFRIWRSRCGSVTMAGWAVRARRRSSSRDPCPWRRARTRAAERSVKLLDRETRSGPTVTVPDSALARSRMLLSSSSSSLPDEWMTLAYSTWVVGHVVVGVVLELLGEDQQAVQRRAQLVGHVGDELGLVLRGDRELAGLLLDEALGLLDLVVLLLGLDVLLGEQARPAARGPRWTRAALPAASGAPRRRDCDCFSRFSVRVSASMVLRTRPMLSVI